MVTKKLKSVKIFFGRKSYKLLMTKKFQLIFGAGLLTILLLTGIFLILRSANANSATLYPGNCLGSWQNPNKAQGRPEAQGSQFITKENSAVFSEGGIKEIYCGSFNGNFSENEIKLIKSVTLKFSWLVKDTIAETTATSSITIIQPPATSSKEVTKNTNYIINQVLNNIHVDEVHLIISTTTPEITITANKLSTTTANIQTSPISDVGTSTVKNAAAITPIYEAIPTTASSALEIKKQQTSTSSPTSFWWKKLSFLFANDNISNTQVARPVISEIKGVAISEVGATPTKNNLGTGVATSTLDNPIAPSEDFLKVSYTLDGIDWQTLGTVNKSNWQNLSFNIPVYKLEDVEKIQIKIESLPLVNKTPYVYLDGMSLEVSYQNQDQNIDKSDSSIQAEIIKEATKNLPKIEIDEKETQIIKSPGNKNDFKGDEVPIFEIDTDLLNSPYIKIASSSPPKIPSPPPSSSKNPKNFLFGYLKEFYKQSKYLGFIKYAQAQLEDGSIMAEVYDFSGKKMNIYPITEKLNGKTKIRIPKTNPFRPGSYELRVFIVKGNTLYQVSENFTWGLMAINVNKSVAIPSEAVYLQMGVVNNFGDTICDANLMLEITNPLGIKKIFKTLKKGGEPPSRDFIYRSRECSGNSVTNNPDYYAYYQTSVAGRYAMKLLNLDNKFEISDFFEVMDLPPFEVERISATRINPFSADYWMRIIIKANHDFTGQVTETIPGSFQIVAQPGVLNINDSGTVKKLLWNVSLNKDQTIELKYQYKAPNVSPELYLIGPLVVGDGNNPSLFQESRQWQIVADAVAFRSAGTVVLPAPGAVNITLTAPAGVAATDIVLAVIYESAAGSGLTITPPAGWTLVVSTSDLVQKQSVYWALGNVASYVFTLAGNLDTIGFTLAYTGVNNTTPINATAVGQINAASVTITAPSITTVTANAMLVGFFGIITQSTFTSALTIRQSGNGPTQDTNPVGLAAADVAQAVAGASGTKTATASVSGANLGQLVALQPAAGGATLTLTIDTSSVSFVSAITPGTPVSTSSVLTVNTNNATGYNIKINRASTTPTLILSADNATTISDTPNGSNWTAPAATSTAGPSAVWTSGTTQGLGFRVKQTGTVSNTYSSTWWGTSDNAANALYSDISTSTALQVIANTTLGSAANENTTVEYRLDTSTAQESGVYISSPVVYTATVNP